MCIFTGLPGQYILGALNLLLRCLQALLCITGVEFTDTQREESQRQQEPTQLKTPPTEEKLQRNRIKFFSWGRLRIEERRLSSSKFHWEEKYLFFLLAETMKTSGNQTYFYQIEGQCEIPQMPDSLGHTKGAFWTSPGPQWDPGQFWGHTLHTGCKSLAEPSARAWQEQKEKKKSSLTNQPAYSSGADFYKAFNSSRTK